MKTTVMKLCAFLLFSAWAAGAGPVTEDESFVYGTPPVLRTPITISLTKKELESNSVFPRADQPGVDVLFGSRKVRHFPFNRDVYIKFPQEKVTLTKQIQIRGGRNVILEGGDFVVPLDPKMPSCDPNTPECKERIRAYHSPFGAAIAIESPKFKIQLKLLQLDVSGNAMDGIAIRNRPEAEKVHGYTKGISVYLTKSRIINIGGTYETLHGDILQMQVGRLQNLFVYNFQGTTGYQGFFLKSYHRCADPQKPCYKPVEITGIAAFKNVDIRYAACPVCNGAYLPFFIYCQGSRFLSDSRKYRAKFENVRVEASPNKSMRTPAMVMFPLCHTRAEAYPFYDEQNRVIRFPCPPGKTPGSIECPLSGEVQVTESP